MMRIIRLKIVIVFALHFAVMLVACKAFSQTDTQFWFVAPEVSRNGAQRFDEPIYFRISNYDQPSVVTLSMPANPAFAPVVQNIAANGSATLDVSSWLETVENKPANTVLNKGILITASNPVTVYYEVASTYCNCNPEIFALKGRNALGLDFLLPGQTHFNNAGNYTPTPYNTFDIVATLDNTVVNITPSKAIVGHAAGVAFQVVLQQGETWSGVATSQQAANHLHGTVISADKPVAVTLTDDLLHGITGCADLTGDQVIPETLAGDEYVAVQGFLTNGGERLFVLGLTNNTSLSFDGGTTTAVINRKEVYNYPIVNASTYLTSSEPVLVLQTTGFGCELGSAVIPAIGCTGSSSVTFTRTTAQQLGLIIFTRQGDEGGFTLNGSATLIPASAFSAVPGTSGGWMAARITLSLAQVPMGTTCIVNNTNGLFHMGVIIGDYGGGCSYGFFSGFSSLNLGPDQSICPGDSLRLDGGEGYANYLWNTGATSRYLWVKVPGEYWVHVTDNFCDLADTVMIDHYQVVPVDAGADASICQGQAHQFSASDGYALYEWNPGGLMTQSFVTATQGVYTVTATDNHGCLTVDSAQLVVNPLPPPNLIRHQ
ncbi:MAG: IgGFc-binding protein [Bacteroidales bacterium]|nr:IgGFc-binding protein [Bacteroidales bacterium]MDD3665407.1 IgGFc-binding protein [Bacteroidales bacterium]